MPSVDFRTRHQGDSIRLDPTEFFDDLVVALDERARTAHLRATRLGLIPLTLDVAGDAPGS